MKPLPFLGLAPCHLEAPGPPPLQGAFLQGANQRPQPIRSLEPWKFFPSTGYFS